MPSYGQRVRGQRMEERRREETLRGGGEAGFVVPMSFGWLARNVR